VWDHQEESNCGQRNHNKLRKEKKEMQDTDHPETESHAVSAQAVPPFPALEGQSSIPSPTSNVLNSSVLGKERHRKKSQKLDEKFAILSNVAKTFMYLAPFFLGLVVRSSTTQSFSLSFRELINDRRADPNKVNVLLGCFRQSETVTNLDWKIKEVWMTGCRENLPKKLMCVDGKSRKTLKRRHVEDER